MPGGVSSFYSGIPADAIDKPEQEPESRLAGDTEEEAKARQYVISWRNQLKQLRWQKRQIWNECWQLYRGIEDWTDKEDWQAKIVIPKAFNTVKTATNVIKRLMATAKQPWTVDSVNPDDLVNVIRAEKCTDLLKVFLDRAHFLQEFSEGLECSFILGLGVWKVWWGLQPRVSTGVEESWTTFGDAFPGGLGPNAADSNVTSEVAAQGNPTAPQSTMAGGGQQMAGSGMPTAMPQGVPTQPATPKGIIGQLSSPDWLAKSMAQLYPTALPFEEIAPMGLGPGQTSSTLPLQHQLMRQRQIVRKETLEGNLFIRAVDPYNFYWLPGAKFPNRMIGTIEDVEVAKWELIEMANQGVFPVSKIAAIKPQKIDEYEKMSALRWSETVRAYNGPNTDTGVVKLTEFYGPIVYDGKIVKRHAHMLIANDSITLLYKDNTFWHRREPYIAFSPLALPFRTEGVGLVEMVRQIDKALNRIANMSVDTLMFRLIPTFEFAPDAYENPEDFETGLNPGKIFRRNSLQLQAQPIKPIEFPDVSPGAASVQAMLDRYHQEGALITDIQQSLPRYRGIQTATETQLLQQNMDSFMGNMAVDIEKLAVEPLIQMALDLLLQYIDTATDPRVASILGVDSEVLAGMSKVELLEMVQGHYKIKVSGISSQLWKAEALQQLVQFMNLVGQNPQAWLPYINEDALLRRMLESFRPYIHDIENVIADPDTAQAKRLAMSREATMGDLLRLIPQLSELAHRSGIDQGDQALAQQKAIFEADKSNRELQLQERELALKEREMQTAAGGQGVSSVPNSTQALGGPSTGQPGSSGGSANLSTDNSTALTGVGSH